MLLPFPFPLPVLAFSNRPPLASLVLVSVLALAAAPSPGLLAQDKDSWLNQRVVAKYTAPLIAGEKAVDDGTTHRIYVVKKVEGFWLWLVPEPGEGQGGPSGWIKFDQVTPFDQALDFYTEEIRANPNNSAAYNSRGIIWANRKEYDIAIDDYTEAIRLDPNHATAYYNRGNTWGDKGEYDLAIDDYNQAIRLNPRLAKAYIGRGVTWHDKGEYDKAIDDCNQAIRLDPEDAWAYNGRAWIWATCPNEAYREGARAVESAKIACELSDWKEAYFLGTYAAALAEAGEFEEAADRQAQALELLAKDDNDRAVFQQRLELYQAGRPYRAE